MKPIDFIERAWLACEVMETAAPHPEAVRNVQRYELQAVASGMRRYVGRHADRFIIDDPNGSEP